MGIWETIKRLFEEYNSSPIMCIDYHDEDDDKHGMIVVLKNKDKKLCFAYFTIEQWEMIEDTSSMTEKPIEEVVQGIVDDLETVVFIDPDGDFF